MEISSQSLPMTRESTGEREKETWELNEKKRVEASFQGWKRTNLVSSMKTRSFTLATLTSKRQQPVKRRRFLLPLSGSKETGLGHERDEG